VQLEAVGTVAVRDLRLEIGGQIDDVDGVEGAFLRADTTSDAQTFADEGDSAGRIHLDAELACAHHGAGLLAFLSAFLGFALVAVDDGDTVTSYISI